jgi:hypothetical protein
MSISDVSATIQKLVQDSLAVLNTPRSSFKGELLLGKSNSSHSCFQVEERGRMR